MSKNKFKNSPDKHSKSKETSSQQTSSQQTSNQQTSNQATSNPQASNPQTSNQENKKTNWNSYGLDREAQKLVLAAKKRDEKSLNQSHVMRMTVPYGLERFWGEHLRLQEKEKKKSLYWKETWDSFVKIMKQAEVTIPNDEVDVNNVDQIQAMSERLWGLSLDDQRISLAVLTQLCDCLVWWTQRYKSSKGSE
jgi:hypothetical protein